MAIVTLAEWCRLAAELSPRWPASRAATVGKERASRPAHTQDRAQEKAPAE